MAIIRLIRVDCRLIHGQVMTMWTKTNNINHVLAIDDALADDAFLRDIYKMAVPSTLKVDMWPVHEAVERYQNHRLEEDNYLILFKDVETAYRAWKSGFPIEELQIGNLNADGKSKIIHRNSRLSKEHLPLLVAMMEGGVRVYTQSVPTEKKVILSGYLDT